MRIANDDQFIVKFPKPTDRRGQEAEVQAGSVGISVTNDTASAEPDPSNPDDPYSALIKGLRRQASDGSEVASVTISADADLGEGVKTISKSFALEVTGGEAAGFGDPVIGEVTKQDLGGSPQSGAVQE